MKNEQVVLWGTLGPAVSAFLLALLYRYFPGMGEDLIVTSVAFVVIILPIALSIYRARSKVFSAGTVANEYVKKEE